MLIGNLIDNGGLASLAIMHPTGQDDRSLTGVDHVLRGQLRPVAVPAGSVWGLVSEKEQVPALRLLKQPLDEGAGCSSRPGRLDAVRG